VLSVPNPLPSPPLSTEFTRVYLARFTCNMKMPLFPRRTNGNLWLAFQCFCSMEKCMGECKRLSSVRKVSSSRSLRLKRWKVGGEMGECGGKPGGIGRCVRVLWVQVHISCIFMARALSSELCLRPISPAFHWHVARWAMSPSYLVIDMTSEKGMGEILGEGRQIHSSPAGLCNWIARCMARIFGILQFDWRFLSLTELPLIWIDFRVGQTEYRGKRRKWSTYNTIK